MKQTIQGSPHTSRNSKSLTASGNGKGEILETIDLTLSTKKPASNVPKVENFLSSEKIKELREKMQKRKAIIGEAGDGKNLKPPSGTSLGGTISISKLSTDKKGSVPSTNIVQDKHCDDSKVFEAAAKKNLDPRLQKKQKSNENDSPKQDSTVTALKSAHRSSSSSPSRSITKEAHVSKDKASRSSLPNVSVSTGNTRDTSQEKDKSKTSSHMSRIDKGSKQLTHENSSKHSTHQSSSKPARSGSDVTKNLNSQTISTKHSTSEIHSKQSISGSDLTKKLISDSSKQSIPERNSKLFSSGNDLTKQPNLQSLSNKNSNSEKDSKQTSSKSGIKTVSDHSKKCESGKSLEPTTTNQKSPDVKRDSSNNQKSAKSSCSKSVLTANKPEVGKSSVSSNSSIIKSNIEKTNDNRTSHIESKTERRSLEKSSSIPKSPIISSSGNKKESKSGDLASPGITKSKPNVQSPSILKNYDNKSSVADSKQPVNRVSLDNSKPNILKSPNLSSSSKKKESFDSILLNIDQKPTSKTSNKHKDKSRERKDSITKDPCKDQDKRHGDSRPKEVKNIDKTKEKDLDKKKRDYSKSKETDNGKKHDDRKLKEKDEHIKKLESKDQDRKKLEDSKSKERDFYHNKHRDQKPKDDTQRKTIHVMDIDYRQSDKDYRTMDKDYRKDSHLQVSRVNEREMKTTEVLKDDKPLDDKVNLSKPIDDVSKKIDASLERKTTYNQNQNKTLTPTKSSPIVPSMHSTLVKEIKADFLDEE